MQSNLVQPYLYFGGRCEEALEFYTKAVGAKVEFKMLFSDSPEPLPPGVFQPGFENKVMHTSFRIGGSVVMASDGCDDKISYNGFSLALSVTDEAEAERAFNGLAEGGMIKMPLTKTFWSPKYGMLIDKFGVHWMVITMMAPSDHVPNQ